MLTLLSKLPPFSLPRLAWRFRRRMPGLLWVGGLGYLAWRRFGPQITEQVQSMLGAGGTSPFEQPSGGPLGGPAAHDLPPSNAAPVVAPDQPAETGVTGLVVGEPQDQPSLAG